ncbi:MAG: RidA family protein [Nitrososphaerales archaeon]
MSKRIISPKKVWDSKPYAFSQGVSCGGKRIIFIAGQVGIDPTGKIVSESIEKQTEQAFENMQQILRSAKASMENVAKLTVYLTDIKDLQRYSEVMKRYFKKGLPAQTAVEVSRLALPELKIEVEAIAVV